MSNAGANIDQHEIEQFNAQAGEWWDRTGPFAMLHRLGPPRLAFIRAAAQRHLGVSPDARRPLIGLNCLDVGCGGGLIAEPLTRLGANVTAIDPGSETIGAAKAHAQAANLVIDYRVTTAEALAAEAHAYDVVTCLDVIEHVPEPADLVSTLSKLVKPGGCLIISTINRTPKSYALAIIGAEYVLGWLPRGTHDWNRFVTTGELRQYATAAGLNDFHAEGIVYHLIADAWKGSPDADVNYISSMSKASARL